jgi:hypothetical protein
MIVIRVDYNPTAIPIKHAITDLYQQPLPSFDKAFPDNKNGFYTKAVSYKDVLNEINNLK